MGLSYNRNTGRRKDWPGFLNSTGRLRAQNNAPSKMPGAHPVR